MRASVLSDWLAQRLVRGGAQPIYRQLHRLLQQAILSRELPAGTRVPSSRLLAAELGIARNTVTQVYEQLALEGYVNSATGRGTFVADSAPDEIVGAPTDAAAARPARPGCRPARRATAGATTTDHRARPSGRGTRQPRRAPARRGRTGRRWSA